MTWLPAWLPCYSVLQSCPVLVVLLLPCEESRASSTVSETAECCTECHLPTWAVTLLRAKAQIK